MATADLGGLGANEGPPVLQRWSGMSGNLSAVLSPRVVPWLAILGLCLLKPNRHGQVWWVWLPLFVTAGLGPGFARCAWPSDQESREIYQSLLMALGFGWAGMLLLAPAAPWPRRLGRFAGLLLGLGVFALLGLAFGRDWGQGIFSELTDMACAVMLQFMVFGLAAALSFAGWFTRRRFTTPAFLGWTVLWLILVWLALAVPYAALNVLGGSQALVAVLAIAGSGSLISFVVTLPFLVLAAANPLYRQRLQQIVVPPDLQNSEV